MVSNYVLIVENETSEHQINSSMFIDYFRRDDVFKRGWEKKIGVFFMIGSSNTGFLLPDPNTCLIGKVDTHLLPERNLVADLQDLARFLVHHAVFDNEEEIENNEKKLTTFQGGWIALKKEKTDVILVRDFPGHQSAYFFENQHFLAISNSLDRMQFIQSQMKEKCWVGAVPPGITTRTGQKSRSLKHDFNHSLISRRESIYPDKRSILRKLEKLLMLALDACLLPISKDKRVAVLLSGGLDSSVLVLLLEKIGFTDYELFFTGISTSKDLEYARLVAQHVDKQLNNVQLDEKQVEEVLYHLTKCLPGDMGLNPVHVSIAVPSLLVLKEVRLNEIDYFLAGQGADELFGGYARYRELYSVNRLTELVSMLKRDILHIGPENLDRDTAVAALAGVKPLLPYLDVRVIEFVTSLNLDLLFTEVEGKVESKILLRELALELGLPEVVVKRPKTAMQYGTGVMKLLKRGSKKHKKRLREWLKELRES
ncbi:MAG: asparagine synthase C-terminal domain-containing protein [Candidatus Hodarchaeales archaeon]